MLAAVIVGRARADDKCTRAMPQRARACARGCALLVDFFLMHQLRDSLVLLSIPVLCYVLA
jgi:hypothetical protein